jgi:hypothetical protein
MKLVYAVSQWRHPKRPTAWHIDSDAGNRSSGADARAGIKASNTNQNSR